MKLWKIIIGVLGAVGALFAASSKSKEVKELKRVIKDRLQRFISKDLKGWVRDSGI